MEYKDNEGMDNILILPKNSMKTFSERTDKYVHLFGTLKKICLWVSFLANFWLSQNDWKK